MNGSIRGGAGRRTGYGVCNRSDVRKHLVGYKKMKGLMTPRQFDGLPDDKKDWLLARHMWHCIKRHKPRDVGDYKVIYTRKWKVRWASQCWLCEQHYVTLNTIGCENCPLASADYIDSGMWSKESDIYTSGCDESYIPSIYSKIMAGKWEYCDDVIEAIDREALECGIIDQTQFDRIRSK